jgi:hypothetical protein
VRGWGGGPGRVGGASIEDDGCGEDRVLEVDRAEQSGEDGAPVCQLCHILLS